MDFMYNSAKLPDSHTSGLKMISFSQFWAPLYPGKMRTSTALFQSIQTNDTQPKAVSNAMLYISGKSPPAKG